MLVGYIASSVRGVRWKDLNTGWWCCAKERIMDNSPLCDPYFLGISYSHYSSSSYDSSTGSHCGL
jgi:hypothetical protein